MPSVEYVVPLSGRQVTITDVDAGNGLHATVSVGEYRQAVDLDSARDRIQVATATGLTPDNLVALRDRLRDHLGQPVTPSGVTLPAVEPFPLDVLPPVVRGYCESAARSLGAEIPVEMVAGPLLGVVGGLLGNRIGIAAKESWIEFGGLYIALVAKPGSAKTAAITLARKPLARLQVDARNAYADEDRAYREAHAAWNRDKANDDRGPEPAKPRMRHYFTSDITMERLGELLNENAGLSIVVDELRGWLGSFDKYRAGRGSDRQQFLSLWGAEAFKVDRKVGEPLYVPHPVASVIGGLQTDFAGEFKLAQGTDGLPERILPLVLDHGSQRWTTVTVTARQQEEMVALFQQLDSLAPQDYGDERFTVWLSPAAEALWIDFYDRTSERVNAARGLAAGMYQKLTNHAIRFALLLHVLWHPDDPRIMVSAETMIRARTLAEWWGGHIDRYLHLVGAAGAEYQDDANTRRVLRLLRESPERDLDGWLTRSDLYSGLRNLAPTELDAILDRLLVSGRVERRTDQADGAKKPRTWWRSTASHFSYLSLFSPPAAPGRPINANNANNANGLHTTMGDADRPDASAVPGPSATSPNGVSAATNVPDAEAALWAAPPPDEPADDDDDLYQGGMP